MSTWTKSKKLEMEQGNRYVSEIRRKINLTKLDDRLEGVR